MHSTRRLVTAAAGLALVLTAAPARLLQAQTTQDTAYRPWRGPTTTAPARPTPTPTTPTTAPATQATGQAAADSAYIREAAGMNQLEVRLGTMAGQRASNAAVKQFAEQMVTSHRSMGQQWTWLAAQNGLPATVALNSIQQQQVNDLSKRSGADFDRAYMNAMVDGHDRDAATLQRIGAGARSAEVKRLAASGVATTQQQLSRARQVASQVGATGAVATNLPSAGDTAARRRTDEGKGNLADGRYAQELAYDHIMEVRLAQMAQRRAKNKDVKQFANRMADEFAKWQQRWTSLASKHGGVKVNPNMGPLHQQKIDRLEKASKGNFDQVYINIVVENLGSMVPYLQKEGRAANSADVRNAADEELPSVRERLSAAQRLDRQVQANGNGNAKEKEKEQGKGRSLSNKE